MAFNKLVPGFWRSPEEKLFTEIYRKKSWGGLDSASGAGSDYEQTEVVRSILPLIVQEYGCKSIVDVPCGDFFWMSLIDLDVCYIGGDIVRDLINSNERKFGDPRRSFVQLDLIRDPLPKSDLVVCRDCLVHFSSTHVFKAVENIKTSKSMYILTTTFPERRSNEEISTGSWRPINLQLPPFFFPPPIRLYDERCPMEGYRDKHLGLWRIEDLAE